MLQQSHQQSWSSVCKNHEPNLLISWTDLTVCLIAGIPLALASANAQGTWLEAVEERVAVTSRVLGVMKSIKMTGLTETIANNIRDLRSQEIEASFLYRLYGVIIMTVCEFAISNLLTAFLTGIS